MKMEITVLDNGIKLVKLEGRLDLKGTNEIDDQFAFAISPGKGPTVVDMSKVDFLASIGMRMLLSAAKALARRGGKMVLLQPIPLVKDALITAGFDVLIPIYDHVEEAYAAAKENISQSNATDIV
jgi:anti-anti-sigma factor